ncbi:TPA: hypothetical protein DDZ86_00210 [Candidatus Dependentiae bacterium]|nr:MAG: hypothetical protein UW09_C0002G0079 [candidate division TM6 bacterium GW2011_GWF2_43_87]HBL98051.1 hypothetical protein [Candidatus Dependentiae bacterium]
MIKKSLSQLSLAALLSVIIIGQANAMRGPVLKPATPVYEKSELCFDAPKNNSPKSLNVFMLEYEKSNPLSKNTKKFYNALVNKNLKSGITLIDQFSQKELMEALMMLDFLCLDSNTFEYFTKAFTKRIAQQGIEFIEQNAELLEKFEPKQLKSLAHQALVKLLESAKKNRDVIRLNEKRNKIFQELPEGLKNHFIYKGCVMDYDAPLSDEKILQLKKWLAKNGGPEVMQKIIDLLKKFNLQFVVVQLAPGFNIVNTIDYNPEANLATGLFVLLSATLKHWYCQEPLLWWSQLIYHGASLTTLKKDLSMIKRDIPLVMCEGLCLYFVRVILGVHQNLTNDKLKEIAQDIKDELERYA